MPISPRDDQVLHSKLPIDPDEKILAIYRHHWFAYASSWIVGIIVALLVMGISLAFSSVSSNDGGEAMLSQTETLILVGGVIFSALILLGTSIPVYLRSQEQMVLTEEAILEVLQPSLFASKVSQLSLQHITDVSVQQDFFGTILGYGYITIETPGEQNNYRFAMLPNPHTAAREIVAAHENFDAALQAGRLHTTLGTPEAVQAPTPQIDPQQYQQFLQYQQMVAQQQAAQNPQTPTQSSPPNTEPPKQV